MLKFVFEDTDHFFQNDFLDDDCSLAELEWKLMRGVLSKQSRPLWVYQEFSSLHDCFWNSIKDKNIKSFKPKMQTFLNKIQDIGLTPNDLKEIKICKDKILDYFSKRNVENEKDKSTL